MSDGPILLTGSTGFVGMELLARYLERTDRRVITLIRARDDAQAQERVHGVLVNMLGADAALRYRGRVSAVAGELTAESLGLGQARFNALADEVSTIVHSAASVSFTLPIEVMGEPHVVFALDAKGTVARMKVRGTLDVEFQRKR